MIIDATVDVASYNRSVDDGTLLVDPRFDSEHPLNDVVCGWCAKIHSNTDVIS